MAKGKPKEKNHGTKDRTDEELLDQGLEDEDLGLDDEEVEEEDAGFEEDDEGVSTTPAAHVIPAKPREEKQADQKAAKSSGLPGTGTQVNRVMAQSRPEGPDRNSVAGIHEQALKVRKYLADQTHPKLIKAQEHIQQAIVWLEDFLRSK